MKRLPCCKTGFSKTYNVRFENLLAFMNITDKDKRICKDMYLQRINKLRREYAYLTVIHFMLATCVNIGSVIVPSFTALQKLSLLNETTGLVFYWLTFSLSIVMMVANKLLYAFNINRRYMTSKESLHKHYNEGWQFITRVVRYRRCKTDAEAFTLFCTRLAKMDEKSIEMISSVEKPQGDTPHNEPPPKTDHHSEAEPTTPLDRGDSCQVIPQPAERVIV